MSRDGRGPNEPDEGGAHPEDASLRSLLGAGATKLPADRAMRAREVSCPDSDLEAAVERNLVIRHARPVDPAPGRPMR